MQPIPSELVKTRRFQPKLEAVTTPFVRVTEDHTVRFSRPYERLELDLEIDLEDLVPVELVDIDLSTVDSIGDATIPFALESEPIARVEPSEPYDLIEMRISAPSVPAVAEPLRLETALMVPHRATNIPVVIAVATVLISAFAVGVGVVFAL